MQTAYASSFSSKIRSRGRDYAESGLVSIKAFEPGKGVIATVSGSDLYDVLLTVSERNRSEWVVQASCTCPFIDNYGDPCKHIYATMMAAERRGFLAGAPKRVDVDLDWEILDGDDDEDWSFDEPDNGADERGPDRNFEFESPAVRSARRKSPAAKRTPGWEQTLTSLAQAISRRPDGLPGRANRYEPLYVVQPPRYRGDRAMTVALLHRERLKSGDWGKPKSLHLKANMIPQLATDLDRRICLMMIGASRSENNYGSYRYYGNYSPSVSEVNVPAAVQRSVVPMLHDTGRLYLAARAPSSSTIDDLTPLRCDRDGPWELALRFEPDGANGKSKRQRIVAGLRRGDAWRPANEVTAFFDHYALTTDAMFEVDGHGTQAWWERAGDDGTVVSVPSGGREKVLKRLAEVAVLPPVEWPAEWNIEMIADAAPAPRLALRLDGENLKRSDRKAAGEVSFGYGEAVVGWTSENASVMDVAHRRQYARDISAERERIGELFELGMKPSSYDESVEIRLSKIPGLVYGLLQRGWDVTGNRKLFHAAGTVTVETTSGIDWFDMAGGVVFDGIQADLPELLKAWRKGEKFVRLSDGSWGMLPEEWLAQHGALLEMGREVDGNIRFARTQIGVLDALLERMPGVSFDDTIAKARKQLEKFDGIKPRKPLKSFAGELRPYQANGLGWLSFLEGFGWGGCLADDMGLGKTVQVLAQLLKAHSRRQKDAPPSLVVVPKSVVFNWLREAERFAPRLRVLDYTGLERKQWAERFGEFDVVLTTYGTLRRDIEALCAQSFNYVILDEAQAIKNPNSHSAKSVRLLQGKHRLAMTGTPVENHLGDLWSISEFLNPGLLGSHKTFQRSFAKPVKSNGDGADVNDDGHLALLHRMLRPFILRRTKQQVAPELPQRSEQLLECELPPKQRKYYDELRDHYRASVLGKIDKSGLARNKMHVLAALLRLRQAACHPGLIDARKNHLPTAKLDTLLPMIEEIISEGHKALVFSQFTSMLAIVRHHLDGKHVAYEYLDGKTRRRDAIVDRFQSDGACKLFLISLKAGGTGLNLTAADYVFILDPWWNPAVEAQAIDRTHRIGQDKHVIAYRLIAKDTVESKILELQQRKRDLAEAIVTEANSLISQLTREDLTLLLS